MNKFNLNAKKFNALQRDPAGAKVQRHRTHEFRGLGVDLGKSKKSIVYRYKSPETGKFRIVTLDSYSYAQELDAELIDHIVSDHYQLKDKIRAGIDPLEIKNKERQQRKQAAIEAKEAQKLAEEQEYTVNRAFDDYCQDDMFTESIADNTRLLYVCCFNHSIAPILGKHPLKDLKRMDIKRLIDTLSKSQRNLAISIFAKIQEVSHDL